MLSKRLTISITNEFDIPAFEEAFDPFELKKFYQDRDSISTFSPKSLGSPWKNSPKSNKDHPTEHDGTNKLRNNTFHFGMHKQHELSNNDYKVLDNIWKIGSENAVTPNPEVIIEDKNLSTMLTNSNKSIEKKEKLVRKRPFLIIRDTNKKFKKTTDFPISIDHNMKANIEYNEACLTVNKNPCIKNGDQNISNTKNKNTNKRVVFLIERKTTIPYS